MTEREIRSGSDGILPEVHDINVNILEPIPMYLPERYRNRSKRDRVSVWTIQENPWCMSGVLTGKGLSYGDLLQEKRQPDMVC